MLKRANEIVEELIGNDLTLKARAISTEVEQKHKEDFVQEVLPLEQLSIFSMSGSEDIITEIRDLDLNKLTPIDALNKLYQYQKKIKDRI